jgi:hypothetical protein
LPLSGFKRLFQPGFGFNSGFYNLEKFQAILVQLEKTIKKKPLTTGRRAGFNLRVEPDFGMTIALGPIKKRLKLS